MGFLNKRLFLCTDKGRSPVARLECHTALLRKVLVNERYHTVFPLEKFHFFDAELYGSSILLQLHSILPGRRRKSCVTFIKLFR